MKKTTICRFFSFVLTTALTAAMLCGCGSQDSKNTSGMGKSATDDNAFGTPTAFGTVKVEDELVPSGTPETTVDVQSLYNSIQYTPEMFCGEYKMYHSRYGSNTRELSRMYEKCETMEIKATNNHNTYSDDYLEKHPTVVVSKLPVRIRSMEGLYVGSDLIRTFGTVFASVRFLKPDTEYDGKYNNVYEEDYKLDVEGNQLVLRRVEQIDYIEESGRVAYTLADDVIRYGFSFRGCDLTLTADNGQSVTLNSCLNAYCEEIGFYGTGCLKAGSKTAHDNINSIHLYHSKEENTKQYKTSFDCGRKDYSLSERGNGSIALSDNGLMEITFPPLKGEAPVTQQFLYFYLGMSDTESDGGFILTNGTDTYYYTARYIEGTIGSACLNLSLEDEKAAESLTPEQLAEIEQKQADLLTDLGAAFRSAGLEVNLNPDTGEIVMASNVLFGGDSAVLTADAKKMLSTFAKTYASVVFDPKYDGFLSKIFVEGHTAPLRDSTYESGLPLSKERAENVVAFCLSDEAGVDPAYRTAFGNMMTAIGYSCGNPIYQENGEPDLNASRRVAFRFQINLKSVS